MNKDNGRLLCWVLVILFAFLAIAYATFPARAQDVATTAPVSGPLAPSGVVSEPMPSPVAWAGPGTLRAVVASAKSGDTIRLAAGTYRAADTRAASLVLLVDRPMHLLGEPGVIFDGQRKNDTLMRIAASGVTVEQIEFIDARREGLVVMSPATDVLVRYCWAHDCRWDSNFIGGAFRVLGPCKRVTFERCVSNHNCNGFEFRENPTQSAATAYVPPKGMAASQWGMWPGWIQYAAQDCTIRRCIAFDNDVRPESSNGIQPRYAIGCRFEDNLCFRNADDNIDGVGSTRCVYRGNVAWAANPAHTTAGDGNGIKVGVRGGLDNVITDCISFDNPRAGIDNADTQGAICTFNICDANGWYGIWAEATPGHVRIDGNTCAGNAAGPWRINSPGTVADSLANNISAATWPQPGRAIDTTWVNPSVATIDAYYGALRAQVRARFGR